MKKRRLNNGDLTSEKSCAQIPGSVQRCVTVECLHQNNEMTSTDKLNNCTECSQTTKLSKTLEADLTSNAKVLQPFWNEFCQEMSQKLWLPTKTDCAGSDSTSLNGLFKRTVDGSWFLTTHLYPRSKNLSPMYFQSCTCSHAESTDLENTVVRSRRIRIYPTADQRKTLRKILGISRYTYNATVAYLKEPGTKVSWMGIKTSIISSLPEWADAAPYQVRSIAVKEACKAVSNAKRRYVEMHKSADVRFRTRKTTRQSCYIPKLAINEKGFFTRVLGVMQYAEQLPIIEYDCRLIYEYGKWFVSVPFKRTVNIPKTKELIVSLDPGIRTFQTYYSLTGAGSIGQRAWEKILGYCYELDKLTTKLSSSHRARRQNLKRAAARLRYRVACLKNELHTKVAVWLCKNYELIVIPEFVATEMSKRHKRKLTRKTVRAMLSLGHSQFRTKLVQFAELYGSHVIFVNEAYTSKTCTKCGHIHEKLGGSKVFKCPACGTTISRDINGARNIMLRAMLDQTASETLA